MLEDMRRSSTSLAYAESAVSFLARLFRSLLPDAADEEPRDSLRLPLGPGPSSGPMSS